MKRLISILLISLSLLSIALPASAATRVRGYTTKRGAYVAPHYRSTKDYTKHNNYSYKGNRNPYTGKKGYKR